MATEPGSVYDTELTKEYVSKHLFYSVEATLEVKKLSQPRSWRIQSCVSYDEIEMSTDVLCDRCYGVLPRGPMLLYIVQTYQWLGSPRVSVYLYGGATGLNPLSRTHHQLDSNIMELFLATREI